MRKSIFLWSSALTLLSLLSGCTSQPEPLKQKEPVKKLQGEKKQKQQQTPQKSAALTMQDYVTWQNVYKDDDNENLYVDLVIVDLPKALEKQKEREPQAYALYEEYPDVYHQRLKEYFRRDTCMHLLQIAQKNEEVQIRKVFNTHKGRLYYQVEETKESCEQLFR